MSQSLRDASTDAGAVDFSTFESLAEKTLALAQTPRAARPSAPTPLEASAEVAAPVSREKPDPRPGAIDETSTVHFTDGSVSVSRVRAANRADHTSCRHP